MDRRGDRGLGKIFAWAFLCLTSMVIFAVASGALGYFAISLFKSHDYFFSAICAALFIKFLIKKD